MIGARIKERLGAVGISQSELARRVGITQGTIAGLISGRSRSSSHLHKIARALRTTPAYLEGEIDDPAEDATAPPPIPPIHLVTMQVALPPERALARMFEGLLRVMDRAAPLDEQALLLAQRLPIGLSQLQNLLPAEVTPADATPQPSRPIPVPARQ